MSVLDLDQIIFELVADQIDGPHFDKCLARTSHCVFIYICVCSRTDEK